MIKAVRGTKKQPEYIIRMEAEKASRNKPSQATRYIDYMFDQEMYYLNTLQLVKDFITQNNKISDYEIWVMACLSSTRVPMRAQQILSIIKRT